MSGPMEPGENRGAGGSAGSRNNGLAKELFWFALPLILSGLLQQLYNIVDSLIIGNVLGEEALAAAGASGPILNLFIYVCTGLVTGCTILVSHAWGAGERKKATAVAATFGLFLLAGSLALAGIGLCLHRGLLSLLHTPEALLAGASEYLSVVFLGIPFLALYNLAGALLRGTGNSRTPLVAIILASLVNVGLDLLLVWGLEWGIRGAAVATVIAQALSAFYLLWYLRQGKGGFYFTLSPRAASRACLAEGLKLSLPRVIQSGASSLGSLLLQSVMNSFGVDVVAAITTSYKVDSLAILPILNMSTAISVFTGQSIGAGDRQRALECLRRGRRLAVGVALCITVLLVFGGRFIVGLFGVPEEVMDLGQRFFWLLAAFYRVLACNESVGGFLQGVKDVAFPAVVNIAALWLRVALSYGLAGVLGSDVIALSEGASWVFALVCFTLRYRSGRWKRRVADELARAGSAGR